MSKTIVICCDGTWNRPESEQDPASLPTNVLKLVRSVVPRSGNREQVVYYDAGVGTGGIWDKWVGGAMGAGVSDNIMQAYRFLVNNWAEGDRIYLFGFSRGAYTVRSLAGLIHLFGLLPKQELKYFPCIYRYYRTEPSQREALDVSYLARNLQEGTAQSGRRSQIHFLGVWDTVGALGVPLPGLRHLSQRWVGFHDTQLSDTVRAAVQAVAVDELRKPFAADLWTVQDNASEAQRVDSRQRILQVWMPGSHSDVGGGFAETELSDLALDFMFDEARAHGLILDPEAVAMTDSEQQVLGRVHDRQNGFYRLLGDFPRPIGITQATALGLEAPVNEKLHWSLDLRREQNIDCLNKGNLYAAMTERLPVYHHRAHVRLPVTGEAELALVHQGDHQGEYCQVIDYSTGGVRVAVPLSPDDGGTVRIQHALWGERAARIRWVRGHECGLAFAA